MARSPEIQPRDFYSACPPNRIMGAECEYGINAPRDNINPVLGHLLDSTLLKKAGHPVYTQPHNINHRPYMVWFKNTGGRAHIEMSFLLEYATPESAGPVQAAATDAAGMDIMDDIATTVRESGADLHGIYRRTGPYATKNVVTTGHHLNFLMTPDLLNRYDDSRRHLHPLLDNIATRFYAYNGMVWNTGFVWSQKALGICRDIAYDSSHLAASMKPMVRFHNTSEDNPDDDIDTTGKWARGEIRMSDGSIAFAANYLTFAVSSLMFRIAEHWNICGKRASLEKFRLSSPVNALRTLATSHALETPLLTIHGKYVYADEVQEEHINTIKYLSQHIDLPPDELYAIPLWEMAVQAMRTVRKSGANDQAPDVTGLADIGDAGRKLLVLRKRLRQFGFEDERCLQPENRQRYNTKEKGRLDDACQAVREDDLQYDRVDSIQASRGPLRGTGLELALRTPRYLELSEQYVPRSLIKHYTAHTPSNTRARQRTGYLKRQDPWLGGIIQWNGATFYDPQQRVSWDDPYGGAGN